MLKRSVKTRSYTNSRSYNVCPKCWTVSPRWQICITVVYEREWLITIPAVFDELVKQSNENGGSLSRRCLGLNANIHLFHICFLKLENINGYVHRWIILITDLNRFTFNYAKKMSFVCQISPNQPFENFPMNY